MSNQARHTPRQSAGARRRRKKQSWKGAFWLLIAAVVLIIGVDFLMARNRSSHSRGMRPDYDSNLTAVRTNPAMDEEIVGYTAMTVSFNADYHVPNWVAYELTADEARGEEPRYNKFQQDRRVKGCATPADYRNTGFDRGHMAPAADMKWDSVAMRESFMMTNIVPQIHSINSGAWSKLEDKCRSHAIADSAVYIVSGPVLTDPIDFRIGATGVAVPRRFFKVILSPYSDPPQAIGFIVPNEAFKGGIQACAVSVDSVEALTGHDFFSALPDDIEEQLESTPNFHKWSRINR
ncbi:MAG: DNA/RNA non-specific endonuclease [Muribaculaceae bacterium]|nr:DNA/RNA non-specific endonuclease [Muribaculaceae bacterium]